MILGGEAHLGTAGRLAVSNAKGEILVSNTLKTLFYYSLRKPVPRTLVWCHSQNWNQSHLAKLFLVHLLHGHPQTTPDI